MALNPNTVGTDIAAYVQANKPAAGAPVDPSALEALWQGIMTIIYNDLKANAGVAPGTFTTPSGGPVTGVGGPLE